jgi:arylsulfatase A-like enzyme
MTGKYPVRTGVTDWIPGETTQGSRLVTKRTRTELALEEVTIGEAMREGGYQTFYAGKWHLGGEGFGPDDQGFEVVVSDEELGDYNNDWRAGQRLTDLAIKFLNERNDSRPFFMYLSYHEPHTPILKYPDHIAKFRKKAAGLSTNVPSTRTEHDGQTRIVQNNPAYGSEVAGLDALVGRLLAKLDQDGLTDNTIVIFYSDNGGLSTKTNPGPTSNEPLRAGKGWLYEGGVRVPLIVRAPGITKAGALSDFQVISTDFYPTLLALAALPAKPVQHRDGLDISSVLRGESGPAREALYWHYPHYHGSTWAPGSAMRQGDWKLIHFLEDDSVELYNLESDPAEKKNLAATQPERLKGMRSKLEAWRAETKAYMPASAVIPAKPQAGGATSSRDGN